MDEYKINFQSILDAFTLLELADFKISLDKELDRRIAAKLEQIELEKNTIIHIEYKLHEALENVKK